MKKKDTDNNVIEESKFERFRTQLEGLKINPTWFNKVHKELTKGLYERDEIMKVMLLAILSKSNVFLYGAPGTAKSMLASRFRTLFKLKDPKKKAFFKLLCSLGTTEDNFMGVPILKKLDDGDFVYKTEGFLPDVPLGFLDEIFKTAPGIVNGLLTLMNEKIFFNGNQEIKVPLRSLFAASNELPLLDKDKLKNPLFPTAEAMYDRFGLRIEVKPIKDMLNFRNFLRAPHTQDEVILSEELRLTEEDFKAFDNLVNDVEIDDNILELLVKLKEKQDAETDTLKSDTVDTEEDVASTDLLCSDRRIMVIKKLMQASALINGRMSTNLSDSHVLKWALAYDFSEVEGKTIDDFINLFYTKFAYSSSVNHSDIDERFNGLNNYINDYRTAQSKKNITNAYKRRDDEYFELKTPISMIFNNPDGTPHPIKIVAIAKDEYMTAFQSKSSVDPTNYDERAISLYYKGSDGQYRNSFVVPNEDGTKIAVIDHIALESEDGIKLDKDAFHPVEFTDNNQTKVETPEEYVIRVGNEIIESIKTEVNNLIELKKSEQKALNNNVFNDDDSAKKSKVIKTLTKNIENTTNQLQGNINKIEATLVNFKNEFSVK